MKDTQRKRALWVATSELTLISLVKTKNTYSIMPTFNDYEKGPLCIDDDERTLANPYKPGEMFEQINDIIMVYLKANAFYKEIAMAEENKKEKKKVDSSLCQTALQIYTNAKKKYRQNSF